MPPRRTMDRGIDPCEVRSYDWQGRPFRWRPPWITPGVRCALDVEARDTPGVSWLSSRFALSCDEFLRRWTATEVLAKLSDIPVLMWLETRGLAASPSLEWSSPQSGAWVRAVSHPTHWVTIGMSTTERDASKRPGPEFSQQTALPGSDGPGSEGIIYGTTAGIRAGESGPDKPG